MTEQIKQKLKDILIEHKNIAASEYNDEDAFVGIYFCDLVDIIDSIMQNIGWHPASNTPKDEEEVIAAGDYSTTRAVFHEGKYYIAEYYHNPESLNCALKGVKWWCYPPEKKE